VEVAIVSALWTSCYWPRQRLPTQNVDRDQYALNPLHSGSLNMLDVARENGNPYPLIRPPVLLDLHFMVNTR
jgi:hypothetical protein